MQAVTFGGFDLGQGCPIMALRSFSKRTSDREQEDEYLENRNCLFAGGRGDGRPNRAGGSGSAADQRRDHEGRRR